MFPPYIVAAAQTGMWDLLFEILLLLGTAMLFGALAERFRQSSIVGYLVAGAIVGPSGIGWVADQEIFHIAELGVALLLFAIGLEFSIEQLRRLGRVPLLSGPLQVVLTLVFGFLLSRVMGLPATESFVLGSLVALSSTATALRLLADRTELDSPYGRASLGILLFQDIAVVPLILVVSALVGGGTVMDISLQIVVSVASAIVLIAGFYGLFAYVVPRFLALRSLRRNRDLPILLAVVTAMGAAWVAHWFSLSPALGAFTAGVLMAVSPYATQIRADVQPLKTVLVTLFFAAVGMFADVHWIVQHLPLVAGLAAVVILGKAAVTAMVTRGLGLGLPLAVATGLCLAQIGEFSFVLAMVARGGEAGDGLISETTFKAFVSVTILTLMLTPYLVASAIPVIQFLQNDTTDTPSAEGGDLGHAFGQGARDKILIIGFGPAGQRVAEELLNHGQVGLVAIDLNLDNLRTARRYGLEVHVGDATQAEILEHAGLRSAAAVLITLPSPRASRHLVHMVRQLSPTTHILVRCRYHIHRWYLTAAGADVVVDEEDHVGHQLASEFRRLLAHKPPH